MCVGGDRDAVFVYISCVINHTFIDLIYHGGIQSCVHCNSMADGTHVCFLCMGYPIYYLCPHDLFKQGHTSHMGSLENFYCNIAFEFHVRLLQYGGPHSSMEEIHLILYCNASLSHVFHLCLSLQLAGRLASSGIKAWRVELPNHN